MLSVNQIWCCSLSNKLIASVVCTFKIYCEFLPYVESLSKRFLRSRFLRLTSNVCATISFSFFFFFKWPLSCFDSVFRSKIPLYSMNREREKGIHLYWWNIRWFTCLLHPLFRFLSNQWAMFDDAHQRIARVFASIQTILFASRVNKLAFILKKY